MKYLSSTDVCQRWQFHPESIRRMIRQGRLPAIRIGRRLLVAQGDVEAFESTRRVVPRSEGSGL